MMSWLAVLRPVHIRDTPFRVRASMGHPRCTIERGVQHFWRHRVVWYVATSTVCALALELGVGERLRFHF